MRTRDEIRELQRRVGTTPDGIWGPLSRAAAQRWLQGMHPKPNPWPKTDQASLTGFYGAPGKVARHTRIDVKGLGVKFSGQTVRWVACNQACAESLERILHELAEMPEGRRVLAAYAGVYYNRPVRGGSTPSLHARAAAIDLDPATNGLRTPWPTRATMPIEVMEVFAREGWLCAGAAWGRDAMHFQATQ